MRDGKEQMIQSSEIVRGDVVVLSTGDIVPADLRLLQAEEIKVNEMCLTGEADDVNKTAEVPAHYRLGGLASDGEALSPLSTTSLPASSLTPPTMVFSSCMVTNGKGLGVVTAVGMNTRVGKIAAMLTTETKTKCGCLPDTSDNMTPMQVGFHHLAVRIGYGALIVCAIVFGVGVGLGASDPNNPEQGSLLYMVLVSVTLAVAAIPHGIPLCVTISLSMGCVAMVKHNVLVRRLAAVETLGSASVICSDKTGTLTEGKMTMVKMWAAKIMHNVSGKGFDPTHGEFTLEDTETCTNDDITVRSTIYAGWLCSNCKIIQEEDEALGVMKWKPWGNSSEAPITVAAGKLNFWDIDGKDESKAHPRILEVPFSSSRKMMMTVHDFSKSEDKAMGPGGCKMPADSQYVSICKGAPNMVLQHCSKWQQKDGTFGPMSEDDKEMVLQVIDDLSNQALRVLAVAARGVSELPYSEEDNLSVDEKFKKFRKDLSLIGLVASIDPEREGVKDAIEQARGAHVRIIMITGDYVKTAIAIARNIGILSPEDDTSDLDNIMCPACDAAMLRPNGEYLPQDDLDLFVTSKRVLTRAQPEDKLMIVQSLQRQGLVVSMTGDGVNDAPALNKADIGVAMGIQGTEVAKGASDMVLTDDNFCSIVQAVEKGRVIYAGIQKFVAFIMSVHIGEVLQIFVCICGNIPVMRTPLQILFLILVTDLPPSIALGMEKSARNILKERPRPKNERLVLPWMWVGIWMNGSILTACALVVYCLALLYFIPSGSTDLTEIAKMITEECEGDVHGCEDSPTTKGLLNARTCAFICVVWCENFRAYVSRSFNRPVCEGMFNNPAMQKAIFVAQAALYVVICAPVLSTDIMKLDGVGLPWQGWLMAIAGAFACLLLCELYKPFVARQMTAYQKTIPTVESQVEAYHRNRAIERGEDPDMVMKGSVKTSVRRTSSKGRHANGFSVAANGHTGHAASSV
jgi:potassium/sodium efflux P-type ATPase